MMIYAQYIEQLRWSFLLQVSMCYSSQWMEITQIFSSHRCTYREERKITSFQPWTIDYEEILCTRREGREPLRSIDRFSHLLKYSSYHYRWIRVCQEEKKNVRSYHPWNQHDWYRWIRLELQWWNTPTYQQATFFLDTFCFSSSSSRCRRRFLSSSTVCLLLVFFFNNWIFTQEWTLNNPRIYVLVQHQCMYTLSTSA